MILIVTFVKDKMLRIQKVGAQVMNEDMAHKAAKKMDAMGTDKGMNQYNEIYRYYILCEKKSTAELANEDALFAARVIRNEEAGIAPRTQQIGSDNPDNEEKRWGGDGNGLMPWLTRGKEVLAVGEKKLSITPCDMYVLLDASNMAELPHHLAHINRTAVRGMVGFDCEWLDTGVDLIQISSARFTLLIRSCFFPRNIDSPLGEMPSALQTFLTGGLVKVGICQGMYHCPLGLSPD
jgi:hypothetical protein